MYYYYLYQLSFIYRKVIFHIADLGVGDLVTSPLLLVFASFVIIVLRKNQFVYNMHCICSLKKILIFTNQNIYKTDTEAYMTSFRNRDRRDGCL